MKMTMLMAAALLLLPTLAQSAEVRLTPSTTRIVDGDTIQRGRTIIRAVGYDTPEIHKSARTGYKCDAELQLGLRAKVRLTELLAAPHVATLRWSKGKDEYGRGLARLYSDHRDVGPILIGEGLAHRYDGRTKTGWCPS